ncbi:SPOR domain-containing protein [Castellaniella sp.]|uniref:SPOR domain-containing protein n=1 Tax=Castellaniella sp. TaxID=1955812 RepID=UPI002AFE7ADB|nr:SPOR domain-containing protein [Castellaniella sp.]
MFFRHGSNSDKRATSRAGSATQLKELRTKARRRLIGALALVLAAFIAVPWLFDEPPAPEHVQAPIVVPAPPDGLSPQLADATALPGAAVAGGQVSPDSAAVSGLPADTSPLAAASDPTASVTSGTVVPSPLPAQSATSTPPAPQAQLTPPTAAPKPTPEPPKPKPAPKPADRTDDGSVALALLAGKAPNTPRSTGSSAAQGRYYLQVAAYTTEQDAQARRNSLSQAGVTDAYVEPGQSGGRTVYRLRVGPFGSHEAAQAAQTRLRALGYQNGLISDK